jgi:iron transport multicopper oxidase
MSVAQRYSVLVTARNDTTSNFKIHANFDTSVSHPSRLRPISAAHSFASHAQLDV